MVATGQPAANVARDPVTGAFLSYSPSTGLWTALESAPSGNEVTTGQETLSRAFAVSSIAMTSGVLRLTYLTARRSETVTGARFLTSGTAAGATPTLVRYGLYSVAANGDIALIASTPNDTALFAAANTEYAKAFSAGVALVQGSRYALGPLVVTGATAPTIVSGSSTLPAAEMAKAPRMCGTATGLSDLPSSVAAGSVNNTAVLCYGVVYP